MPYGRELSRDKGSWRLCVRLKDAKLRCARLQAQLLGGCACDAQGGPGYPVLHAKPVDRLAISIGNWHPRLCSVAGGFEVINGGIIRPLQNEERRR